MRASPNPNPDPNPHPHSHPNPNPDQPRALQVCRARGRPLHPAAQAGLLKRQGARPLRNGQARQVWVGGLGVGVGVGSGSGLG